MLLLLATAFAHPSLGERAPVPVRNELAAEFEAAADEFQVPTALLMGLAWEASRFDPDVVSYADLL
ncbi:MAG: hypothetical protein ACK4YP_07300, partial [Myxococcota bacterium]